MCNNMVRIGIGQMQPVLLDKAENIARTNEMLERAAKSEVDVLVLPELANSGYAFQSGLEVRLVAEEVPNSEFCQILKKWSLNDRMVIAGICEAYETSIYNSAVVFANGELRTIYRKVNLFNQEVEWFEPGRKEPPVVEFNNHHYGIMICFDWAFPEIARILALKDAQVILHPANLVLPYCQNAMITRCIENHIFAVTANRIGKERGLHFSGNSQIVSPKGEILCRLGENEVSIVYHDIDLEEADNKMITKRNHVLRDRTPELYERLVKRR
ncbi:MAG: hypothetical protein GF411_16015 [Candidatus Lokiarchaeota archaeon]|nr:hypothetical protein [Candidatus Lokiarchaeota archaeon]